MMLMALLGGVFLCVALALRELQLMKERQALMLIFEQNRQTLNDTKLLVKKLSEDAFVMQTMLVERNLFDEREFALARRRLIGQSHRPAAEQEAVARNWRIPNIRLTDTNDKLH